MTSRLYLNPFFNKIYILKDPFLPVWKAFEYNTKIIMVLLENDITEIHDIVDLGPNNFLSLPGIGKKTFNIVGRVLRRYGVTNWTYDAKNYYSYLNRFDLQSLTPMPCYLKKEVDSENENTEDEVCIWRGYYKEKGF